MKDYEEQNIWRVLKYHPMDHLLIAKEVTRIPNGEIGESSIHLRIQT